MAASKPTKLIVFGDSLSDAGAVQDLTSQVIKVPIPPESAGYAGWFSNGNIQSLVTADLLGAEADVFAVGGARAVGSRTVADYLAANHYDTPEILLPSPDPDVLATDTYFTAQVGRYLAGNPVAEPGTAAAIWIGANDYNALPPDSTPEQVGAAISAVVGTTLAAAGALAATGVQKVFLYNLPAPDFLPVDLPPAFGLVVANHNAALAQGAAHLSSLGIETEIVDMNRMAREITADPGTFGLDPALVNTPLVLGIGSQPTWNDAAQDWYIPANPAVAGVDPDRVMFMDFLHPSSATHGVLGSFAAGSIGSNAVLLGDGAEVRHTGSLADMVLAGGGDDIIFAQGGRDTVLGGLGNDRLFGGGGADILAGGSGDDRVCGGGGNDVVAGSAGNDTQGGGAGRDLLVDGLGWDKLDGGAGNDAFLYVQASLIGGSNAKDGGHFVGGSGHDILYLALDDATRGIVEDELCRGSSQTLDAIGVTTRSIERYVFVDPADPVADIASPARVAEADLWGII